MALTERHLAFVKAFLADGHGERAALAAGYARSGARKAAWRLLRRQDVQDAIRGGKRAPAGALTPLAFLLAVQNDPTVPLARRMRAAAAAAPYMHPKAGAAGKKAAATARAKEAAGRLVPLSAPKLSLVRSDD